MDPYKILGVKESSIKHESDLKQARYNAKKLFKRYAKEKNKFESKKVLEAFDLIKKKLKGGLGGEGPNKILGRSRMERMMDKHYNHQTKEIKGNKDLKKHLKRARKGSTDRLHLPGDKERIPTGRGLREYKRRKRRRVAKKKPKKEVGPLAGLKRLSLLIPWKFKFGKAIMLIRKWVRDYMNSEEETRESVFEVLHEIVEVSYLTEDPDTRNEIALLFEYVLRYWKDWFEKGDDERALKTYWQIGAEAACRCYTDDAFILVSTITKLNEALALLEKHKEELKDGSRYEDDYGGAVGPGPSPASSPVTGASSRQAKGEPSSDEERMSFKNDVKEEDMEGSVKSEDDDEFVKKEEEDKTEDDRSKRRKLETNGKEEPQSELKIEAKPQNMANRPMKAEVKLEVKVEGPANCERPTNPEPTVIDMVDSDDEVAVEIDSGEEPIKEEPDALSSGSDIEELGFEAAEVTSDEGDVDNEFSVSSSSEEEIFPTPPGLQSLYRMRAHYVDRCLETLFRQRGPLWARPKIDAFFQDLYYRRPVFSLEQRTRIEAWQSRIKTMQKFGDRDVGEANNPLEAHRPVVDSRETRTILDSDSNAWAAKQTFDARDQCGGRNVIR